MSSMIDRRLAAYSAAVAAVAAGSVASESHAAIIANTTPVTVAKNTSDNIDLDGNSVVDLSFTNQTGAKNGNNRYYVNQPTGSTGMYATLPFVDPVAGSPQVRPAVFNSGQPIGPTSTYGTDPGALGNTLAGNGVTSGNPAGTNSGYFDTTGLLTQYIGVSFTDTVTGLTDYGWVGVILTPPDSGGSNTVTGYAYDNTGGIILAGQTAPIVNTPEPASLSLLALGGLAMTRRKRAN